MLSMADQNKKTEGVRKSGRLYLKRSFSRFTNNKDTALEVEEGDFQEPNSVPKLGAGESKSSKHPEGRDLASADQQPHPKKSRAVKKRKSGDDDGVKPVKRKDSGIRLRTTPHVLFQTMKDLTNDQRKVVIQMGFESILNMRVDGIPAKLGYYAIDHYNPSEKVIEPDGGRIKVTRERIHGLLGIPMGNIKIALSPDDKDEVGEEIVKWRKQFPTKTIRPSHISNMITEQKEADFNFMISFIILFANVIGRCISNGTCYLNLLSQVKPGTDISKLDWCGYVMDCLTDCKKYWRPKTSQTLICGPMTLLVLLYVESVTCVSLKVVSQGLAINSWTMEKLRKREKEERRLGGFGKGEVIDICKKKQAGTSGADQTEQMDVDQMILLLDDYMHELESSIRVILERKTLFEATMKGAKLIFHENSRLQSVEETFKNIFNQKGCSDIPDAYEDAPQQERSKDGDQSLQMTVSPEKTASNDRLSNSQFWVHPSATAELFKNVDELARRVTLPSGQKRARHRYTAAWSSDFSDLPSFSLGLTQEFGEASKQQLTVFNEHCSDATEFENPELVAQLQINEPNQLEKDSRQPSGFIRSPFIKRKVIELSTISHLETMVSDWVFAMQGDRMQVSL